MRIKRPVPRLQAPGLLVIAAALGLVGCMLFAHPVRRLYVWIAAAEVRLPIHAFHSQNKSY